MRVKILYLGLVRNKVGKKDEECRIEDGSSLSDLLSELAEAYGKRFSVFFDVDKESSLDPTFIVTVNGVLMDPAGGEKVRLRDGDTIALMTLISGG